jgi:hypothetical protein
MEGGADNGFESGGALGGGANGGGNLVGTCGARIAVDSAFNWSISSSSLWALGTISERNSRSSEDNVREFLELVMEDLLDLEKRPKNRETAEGAGVNSSGSGDAN